MSHLGDVWAIAEIVVVLGAGVSIFLIVAGLVGIINYIRRNK